MQTHRIVAIVAVCTFTFALGGAATHAATVAPWSTTQAVVRFDYTLTVTEAGKQPVITPQTITLQEGDNGEVRLGANVPPGPSARRGGGGEGHAAQDLGLDLKAAFARSGDDLFVRTSLELSTADDPAVIHKVTLTGDAVLAPGSATLVTRAEDPWARRRYELRVLATRLR